MFMWIISFTGEFSFSQLYNDTSQLLEDTLENFGSMWTCGKRDSCSREEAGQVW